MKTDKLESIRVRPAEPLKLLPRRAMAKSMAVSPASGYSVADRSTSGLHYCAPVRPSLPDAKHPGEAVPIWLAVLLATPCRALRNGENHTVRWDLVSGRALYTNAGRDAEHIEPLGVSLLGGHTMAVSWVPGETSYTVEVYRKKELCA